ncbi:MAG: AsmA-like C-terminal domain-containing protein, partial [Thermodesulfobacteriota bacterium]|nr:AsmA-like C-terminal domain-containing protein [Thermodesulfobacteriota bacterium]
FVLPVLLVMTLYLPDILKIRQIQTEITKKISTTFNCEVEVDSIRWRWAPLPHLTLRKTRISHENFTASISKIRFYPHWQSLFLHKADFGRILVQKPHITIKENCNKLLLSNEEGKKIVSSLPSAHFVIQDGTIDSESSPFPQISSKALSFSGFNGKIAIHPDRVQLDLKFQTPFVDKCSLQGELTLQNQSYRLTVNTKKFRLNQLLVVGKKDILQPLESETDFTVQAKGTGSENFEITLNGQLPDVSLQRLKKPAVIDLAGGTLRLKKTAEDLTLAMNNVHFNEPELSLSGVIGRSFPKDLSPPLWHLDLTAFELDLTRVREKILTLFGDNDIAQLVCNIVREAQVNQARYAFNGPVSGFNFLDQMLIEVDIATSTIYIPAPDLLLTKAAGPIEIKEGKLTGSGLTAWLGNSRGSNGSVLVGISNDLHEFILDLDIDADITELPDALHHLIDKPLFRSEIKKFKGTGRADAHLIIGDRLDDFSVKVAVTDMSRARVEYERLPWIIEPLTGRLDITDYKAVWTDCSAKVGPQHIKQTNGSASWQDEPQLDINHLDATLEPSSFFSMLTSYPVIEAEITQGVTAIDAAENKTAFLKLTSGKLHGPFLQPENWQYRFDALIKDTVFSSPLLPETVTIHESLVRVDEHHIAISKCFSQFLHAPLELTASLSHTFWMDWYGQFTFNGVAGQAHLDWLAEKEWLSPTFFPRVPCRVDDLTVAWQEETITLDGALIGGEPDNKTIRADLHLRFDEADSRNLSCYVTSKEQQGGFKMINDPAKGLFTLAGFGEIEADSINILFKNFMLESGVISGAYEVEVNHSDTFLLKGTIRINDVYARLRDGTQPLMVKNLFLHGTGNEIHLNLLDMSFLGENIKSTGTILTAPNGCNLNLNLTSPNFSRRTGTRFFSTAKELTGMEGKTSMSLTGKVQLHFDRFSLNTEKETAGNSNPVYPFTPLDATLTLHDTGKMSLDIESAKLCGLKVEGLLEWDQGQGRRRISLVSLVADPLFFQEILPCLNCTNNLIEGQFEFEADISGDEKQWTDGFIRLHSDEGNLRQMIFLANLFRVINFGDILNSYGEGGFPYSEVDLSAHIEENNFVLDRAKINGRGLNLLAEGEVNLSSLEADLTLYVVPLKTIDSVMNFVPLVGRILGGRKRTIITIPVGITGNIKDPEINVLGAMAVGKSALEMIGDALLLPYDLLIKPWTEDENHTENGKDKIENDQADAAPPLRM